MTLTTPYSATFIVGDGETKTFSYLFEEVSPNFISVMVYNSLTGLISTPTYVIDTDQKQVIFGEDTPAPTADETVCIYRNTPNVQDVAFRTLHGYDAQTLENILSKIVAMIQEIKSNYFSTQVLQGDPWQLDLLSSEDDGATVNIDYTAKKLVKGLYFRITSGNLQVSADGVTYLTLPKSDDVAEFRQYEQTLPDLTVIRKLQYRVGNQWFDAEANAQYTADEAYALAESVQTTMSAHINNTQNPHQTSMANLTDTDLSDAESGQFLQFDGIKWKAVYSTASVSWGGILGDILDQADLQDEFDTKVSKSGDTMTGALNILRTGSSNTSLITIGNGTASSRRWNFLPSYNATSLSVYSGTSETGGYRFTLNGFVPASNNVRDLGSSSLKWKAVYAGVLNNGANLVIPTKGGTLATMDDVELAARSGTQLTDQGVWYAKMYAATVPPAAEDGTNYADFSQVAGKGNPIIVTYNRVNGAWVQDKTITPPAEYDGYVLVTSKIWDIAEQTGQQGGRVLWNHTSKEFTPYPQIISFEDINVTGNSTVVMPQNPGANQIVNKDYVDSQIPTVNDPTITITQGGVTKGSFSLNQVAGDTIDLDAGGITTGQSIDAEIVGTPTISGADVSGFSSSDYMKFPGILDFGSDPFEIVVAFTTGSSTTTTQNILFPDNTDGTGLTIQVLGTANNGMFLSILSRPDGSSPYTLIYNNTALNTNTKYYAKLTYNGAIYTLSQSTDGVTYETVATASSPILPGVSSGGYILGAGNNLPANILHMDGWAISKNGQMIWSGMDAPGLHQRVAKGHEVVEFQAPTSTNDYTWYRKYADGWVEQGGISQGSGSSTYKVVSLAKEMSSNNYTLILTPLNANAVALTSAYYANKTTVSFSFQCAYNGGGSSSTGYSAGEVSWQVSGMAA